MTGTRPNDRALRWLTAVDGQQIRHLRRQQGMARKELAGLAGISPDTLARLDASAERAAGQERRPGSPPHWASTLPL